MSAITNTQIPADIFPCDKTCVASPKNGGSWWKNHGYNFPCHCAWEAEVNKNEMNFCDVNRSQLTQPNTTMSAITNTQSCKCSPYWETWQFNLCEQTDASWASCPAKALSVYRTIINTDDEATYNKINLDKVSREKRVKNARKIAFNTYGLTEDECDELEECFANDDANNEEYQCFDCQNPIRHDEEREHHYEGDIDRWVCCECYDKHYCSECKEFFEDEDDLTTKGDEDWAMMCQECADDRATKPV